jgi:hypothetical protein
MLKLSSFLFTNVTNLPPTYSAEIRIFKTAIIANIGKKNFDPEIIIHFKTFYNNTLVNEQKNEINLKDKSNDVTTYKTECPKNTEREELAFIEIDVYTKNNELIFFNRGLSVAYVFFYRENSKSYLTELMLKYGHPNIISQYNFFNTFVYTSPNIFINKKKNLTDTIAVVNPYEKDILVKVTSSDGRKIIHKAKARTGSKIFLDKMLKDGENEWAGCIHITGNNRIIANILKTSITDRNIIFDSEHLDYYMPIKNYTGIFRYIRLKISNFIFLKGFTNRVRKNI